MLKQYSTSIFLLMIVILFVSIVLTGLFANAYASPRLGATVGFMAAVMVSFSMGYLIRKGTDGIKGLPTLKQR